jgi:hypothetical protein
MVKTYMFNPESQMTQEGHDLSKGKHQQCFLQLTRSNLLDTQKDKLLRKEIGIVEC